MKIFKKSMATVGMLCVGAFAVCGLTACSNDGEEALAKLSLLLDEKVESNESGLSADLEVPYSIKVNSNEYLVEYSTNLENAKVETNAEEKSAKIAITQTSEDQSFTLTAKVSSKSKSWDFKIAKKDFSMVKTQAEVDAMENKKTYAEWATQTTGKALIQGYVTHAHDFSASYGNASVWLQDDNGGYYAYRVKVASQADFNDYFKVGSKLAIDGTVSPYNGWQEMGQGCKYYYIKDAETKTYDFKDVTELWGANTADSEASVAVQNQKIKVTGKVTSVPDYNSSSMTVGISVNGQDYNVYYKSAYTALPNDLSSKLKVGYTVEVEGIAAVAKVNNKNCAQICPIKKDAITVKSTEVTAQDKVNGAKAEVSKQNIKSAYYDSLSAPIELLTTTKDGCKVTYSIPTSDTTTFKTNTTIKAANMIDGNNAENMGLPESIFTVTGAKGSQGNLPWNAPNSYRLYSAEDGNGASMIFSVAEGCTIKSVKLTLAADSNAEAVAKVTTGETEVTGTNGEYVINANTFTVQNVVAKKSTQLRFSAIEFVVDVKNEQQNIKLVDGNKLNITVDPEKSSSAKLIATISLDGAEDVTYSWDITTKTREDAIKEINNSIKNQEINLFFDKDTVGSRIRLLEPASPSNTPVTFEYMLGDASEYIKLGKLKDSDIYYFDILKAPAEGVQTVSLKYKFTYDGVVTEGVIGDITVVPTLTPLLKYQISSKDAVLDWDLKGVVASTGYGVGTSNQCIATIITEEGPIYVFQQSGDKEKWAEKFVVGKTVTLNGGKKDIYSGLHEYVITNLDKQVKVGKEDVKTVTPVDLTKLAQDEALNSANWVKQQGAYASITGKLVNDSGKWYIEVVDGKKIQLYFDGKFSDKTKTEEYLKTLTVGNSYTFTGTVAWYSGAQLIPTADNGFAK